VHTGFNLPERVIKSKAEFRVVFLISFLFLLLGCVETLSKATKVVKCQIEEALGEEAYYPKASPDAQNLITLQSNVEGTNFYVDGKFLVRGKRVLVLVADRPHIVKAKPDNYIAKEDYIQPPYEHGYTVGFYFLLEDRLVAGLEQPILPKVARTEEAAPVAIEKPEIVDEVVLKGKPGLSQLPQYDNNFALVVGVSHYKNIPRLPYPEKDIELMQEVVTKIMGVKRKNLFLLKNPTKTEVISQIKKVTRLAGSYNNPKIIFYFSGHGTAYAENGGGKGEGYLLPIEADPEDISTTSVSLREIENLLARAKGEKVVIIDACFSGKGKSILLAGKPFIGIKKVAPMIENTVIFLSSKETQISTYIKNKGVSTFTYALYEMLGKYGPVLDENKNGWLEAKEVAEKLRNFTDNYAIRFANQHQHPVIRGNLDISLAQRP